ncbi:MULTISPECIES: hypothetical protein [Elizabethkingia]|nr:hypothetical protein [Elizabethkingia ursingii]MCL1671774.1 hypothetical protein [Elizabethkingia ursingii]
MKLRNLTQAEQKSINGGSSIGRAIGYYVTEFFNIMAGNRSEDSKWGRH